MWMTYYDDPFIYTLVDYSIQYFDVDARVVMYPLSSMIYHSLSGTKTLCSSFVLTSHSCYCYTMDQVPSNTCTLL
jgi:hypothetical protein